MTTFSELMASADRTEDQFSLAVPEDWLQGRTAYGGLSAALSAHAAIAVFPDLPPLRSAQFTFVGPATGTLKVKPALLRRGKSTTFVQANIVGDDGPAVQVILAFGARRASVMGQAPARAPEATSWRSSPEFMSNGERPRHLTHFDSRLAGGSRLYSLDEPARLLVWLRHDEESPPNTLPGLLALADALPPPALVLATERPPLSTITWAVDLFRDVRGDASPSDHWLVESTATSVMDGYSTQDMAIWTADGAPVLTARQNVAVFG